MKVTGQQPPNLSELTTGKTQDRAREASRTGAGRPKSTDTVENRMTLTTNKVKEAIRNEPDVRGARVAEIKEKLKNGDYKVSTEKLAENMLLASLKEDIEQP